MKWQYKAAVARVCARLPLGDRVYRLGQRHLGELRARPLVRLATQIDMLEWLTASGVVVRDSRVLEVGTGHMPIVPIGFYLSGARECFTVDLNRRVDWRLTRHCLEWMVSHSGEVASLYRAELVEPAVFAERFARLRELCHTPRRFLECAGIHYLAPRDAADTGLPSASIDCHCSVTVLEHIAPGVLRDILVEAKRLLKPRGVALHFVDPSDHFAHADPSITLTNFLRYPEAEWLRIAGNEFAYCNRMRASDVMALAASLGFSVVRAETKVDERSVMSLRRGFRVDARFAGYSAEDLATTALRVMWK
jgi:SAM-dependent methyltransferase